MEIMKMMIKKPVRMNTCTYLLMPKMWTDSKTGGNPDKIDVFTLKEDEAGNLVVSIILKQEGAKANEKVKKVKRKTRGVKHE